MFSFAPLVLLLSPLVSLHGSRPDVVEEDLSDGRRARATVVEGADGAPVRHGDFEVLAPAGTKIVSGEFEQGIRVGRWVYRYWNGRKAAAGKYKAGFRTGTWTTYWPDETVQAKGRFKGGYPTGKWKFFDRAGEPVPDDSGTITHVDGTSPIGDMHYQGTLLGGVPHGWWRLERADRSLVYEGSVWHGEPIGPQRFRHVGSIADDAFFRSTAPGEWSVGHVFQYVSEYGDLRSLAAREREERAPLSHAEAVAEMLADPRLSGLEERPVTIVEPAKRFGLTPATIRASVAVALAHLARLDWTSAEALPTAWPIVDGVIEPSLGRVGLGWVRTVEGADANRLALLRVHSVLTTRGLDDPIWSVDARLASSALPARGGAGSLSLLDRVGWTLWLDEADAKRLAAPTQAGPLVSTEKKDPLADERAAVRASLEWLARESDGIGYWRGGTSSVDGAAHKEGLGHDVGVTALAVLALARAEVRPGDGELGRALADGLCYLLDHQDPESRRIRTGWSETRPDGQVVRYRPPFNWIYDHATATWALVEALDVARTPRLEAAARSAVRVLVEARNPYGAWRYSVPPDGDNDTSVTFWVMRALVAARAHQIVPPPDVTPSFADADQAVWNWLSEVTDPSTGRTGYETVGTRSARISGVNGEFPREVSETLTAEAVALLRWIDVPVDVQPQIELGTRLVHRSLPVWQPDDHEVDYGYWLAGTEALAGTDGRAGMDWRKAVVHALLEGQESGGAAAGSWPPVGAWCVVGGRSYATASAALTLLEVIRTAKE